MRRRLPLLLLLAFTTLLLPGISAQSPGTKEVQSLRLGCLFTLPPNWAPYTRIGRIFMVVEASHPSWAASVNLTVGREFSGPETLDGVLQGAWEEIKKTKSEATFLSMSGVEVDGSPAREFLWSHRGKNGVIRTLQRVGLHGGRLFTLTGSMKNAAGKEAMASLGKVLDSFRWTTGKIPGLPWSFTTPKGWNKVKDSGNMGAWALYYKRLAENKALQISVTDIPSPAISSTELERELATPKGRKNLVIELGKSLVGRGDALREDGYFVRENGKILKLTGADPRVGWAGAAIFLPQRIVLLAGIGPPNQRDTLRKTISTLCASFR